MAHSRWRGPVVEACGCCPAISTAFSQRQTMADHQDYNQAGQPMRGSWSFDVDPERYRSRQDVYAGPRPDGGAPDVIAADKPLLGICRGIQSIYVVGWHVVAGSAGRTQPQSSRRMTEVSIAPDCRSLWPLGDNGVRGRSSSSRNPRACTLGDSYHHQAIRTLGQGLEPATAPDSIVEAVWMPSFVAGILSSLTAPDSPSSTPADASSRQSRRNVFACPFVTKSISLPEL